jgi:hypothetical protein
MNQSNVYGRFVLIDKSTSDLYAFDNEREVVSRFLHTVETILLLDLLNTRAAEFVGDTTLTTQLRHLAEKVVIEGVTAKMLDDVGAMKQAGKWTKPSAMSAMPAQQVTMHGAGGGGGAGSVTVSSYGAGGGGSAGVSGSQVAPHQNWPDALRLELQKFQQEQAKLDAMRQQPNLLKKFLK